MVDVELVGYSAYAGVTTVNLLGVLAVVVLGLCVLLLPRQWSVVSMLVMACFVSSAQRLVIVGLDFDFLRIMLLFGVMRLILYKDYINFVWKPLDTAMVLWMASSLIFYVIREGTFAAVINRFGFGFNAFGMYFLFRCLIWDWPDLDCIILGVIVISIFVALLFLIENLTGRNIFSTFGGVPEITEIREGRLRCQGAYSHPILAGCFWSSLIPLIAVYWWKSTKEKIWAIIGLITSTIIVICSASSTPIMGVLSAVIGGSFFFFRRQMQIIRWGVLLTLIALHIVMKGPVWSLVARISAIGGSTGWHRFNVIDQAIRHFNKWWFSGCSGQTVSSWGIYAADLTNQYIFEGITAGILTMCLFIGVIVVAFREVGVLWRSQTRHQYRLILSWAMGVSLFVHCINFIGVSYFGQIWVLWYLLLAMIGSLSITKKPILDSKLMRSSGSQRNRHQKHLYFVQLCL